MSARFVIRFNPSYRQKVLIKSILWMGVGFSYMNVWCDKIETEKKGHGNKTFSYDVFMS